MSIARQGMSFVLIGCGLIVADWLAFVALTAVGVEPPLANVIGRIVGAILGFWANGRVTFGTVAGSGLRRHHFVRYSLLWLALTVLSTYMVVIVSNYLGLHMAWLAKPLVEAVLALLSFVASRHWVYR